VSLADLVATDCRLPGSPLVTTRGGPFCGRAYSSVKPPQILAPKLAPNYSGLPNIKRYSTDTAAMKTLTKWG
jgi:hypothetical protein